MNKDGLTGCALMALSAAITIFALTAAIVALHSTLAIGL